MTERIRIVDSIDTNHNGIIDKNEYQNFKDVIKNPESRKELVEAIENNQEILLLLKPAIEDIVNDIILANKQDEESMFILDFYNLKFSDKNEDLSIEQSKIIDINGQLFEEIGTIVLEKQKNTQFLQELQENLEKNPQVIKARIIEDIAIVFIQYMENICENINFPALRLLDNDIKEYVKTTKEKIIELKLNNINPESLTDEYLREIISDIFDVSEIHWFGIEDMEILTAWFKENLTDMIWVNIIDTQQARLNLYKQIRDIDRQDNTGRYNSSDIIISRLSNDILTNPNLNNIPEIQKKFEAIQTIFQDEAQSSEFVDGLLTAYFNKTENWGETIMGEIQAYTTDETKSYLIEHGMDIQGMYNDIYGYIETNLNPRLLEQKYEQLEQDILETSKEKGNNLSESELQIETTKQYMLYISLVKETLRKNLKTLWVKWTLKAFPKDIESLKQTDETVWLYTDIEWIGSWDIADRKIDMWKEIAQELMIQLMLIYLSGWVGNISAKLLPQLKSLKQLQNIKNIEAITSSWITVGALDGATFHLTYNTLFNLKEWKNLWDGLMSWKNWAKDILFIGALRWLNTVKTWKAWAEKTVLEKIEDTFTIRWEKLQFSDNIWNKIWVNWISIWAETTILYGLGTGINIMFGEWITNNPDEIMHIITMVLWLKMVNKTHGSINFMANKINGELQTKTLKKSEKQEINGELQVKTLKKVEKQEIKGIHKIKIEKQSRSWDKKPPNTGYESIVQLAWFIPLSELFRLGNQMEEYENIRNKMIQKWLTKQWAEWLSKDEWFIENREIFIDKILSLASVKLRIKENNWDENKVREWIRMDFDDMLYLLWWVEQVKDSMVGDNKEEKERNAIKELFLSNEDERLWETIVWMYNDFNQTKEDKSSR